MSTALRVVALTLTACGAATPPPTRQTLELSGPPYARGFQHGQTLQSEVRAFYTRMLSSSILPNLDREQATLSAVLPAYQRDVYANGQFSYRLLLESARAMEAAMPAALREEMHGIADGAAVSYEQVLITNTFLDAVLSLRAVAQVANQAQAPILERVVVPGLDQDGQDNDGDGVVDNPSEAEFAYLPLRYASRVEIPPDARFVLTLMAPHGVDPSSIRITLNGHLFASGSSSISTRNPNGDPTRLEVGFTPPEPLVPGPVALRIQAGDLDVVSDPPPAHAHFMRGERLTFTVRGTGRPPWEVTNREPTMSFGHPTSFAFAQNGLLGHEFALLDANAAHENTVLFVHHPDNAEAFAVVGWAGMVAGLSGMNAAGLALACEPSDTLNNTMVRGLLAQADDLSVATLVSSGVGIGTFQREALEGDTTVASAISRAAATEHAYGWSCLLQDATAGARAIEVNADPGVFEFGPNDQDAHALPWASAGHGDLRAASHFVANTADMPAFTVEGIRIGPQSGWSTFFYRSLDTWSLVGDQFAALSSPLDLNSAISILQNPALVDPTDSMNAVVFDTAHHRLSAAMGAEPATASPFQEFAFEGAHP